MNWNAIGAIGEIIGSVAVLVTLAYLAIQVRHTRVEMKRSIRQARSQSARELFMSVATDPQLAGLVIRAGSELGSPPMNTPLNALTQRTGISSEDAYKIHCFYVAVWNHTTAIFQYMDELDPGERESYAAATRMQYGVPLARLWYESSRPILDPSVARFVDSLIAQAG